MLYLHGVLCICKDVLFHQTSKTEAGNWGFLKTFTITTLFSFASYVYFGDLKLANTIFSNEWSNSLKK